VIWVVCLGEGGIASLINNYNKTVSGGCSMHNAYMNYDLFLLFFLYRKQNVLGGWQHVLIVPLNFLLIVCQSTWYIVAVEQSCATDVIGM
jgi:hypothetical protein